MKIHDSNRQYINNYLYQFVENQINATIFNEEPNIENILQNLTYAFSYLIEVLMDNGTIDEVDLQNILTLSYTDLPEFVKD